MKIYFAGSIRGGRDDQAIYFEIINLLKKYGEVLTEHVGDKKISNLGQVEMSTEEIFNKDVNWIGECDLLVAEVTMPSVGVGYEIGRAEALKKKIIGLYRPSQGKSLSAMIEGNKNITCISYQEVSELLAIFDRIII